MSIADYLKSIRTSYESTDDLTSKLDTCYGTSKLDPLDVTDEYLTKKYLSPSTSFSTPWLNRIQEIPPIDRLALADNLYTLPDYETRTATHFKRSGLEGKIVGYEEFTIQTSSAHDLTSKNSLSLGRQVSAKQDFVRGRAGFMPFAPGNLELDSGSTFQDGSALHRDADGIFDIAPGISRGLSTSMSVSQGDADQLKSAEDRLDELANEPEQDGVPVESLQIDSINQINEGMASVSVQSSVIDDLLPADITFGRTSNVTLDGAPTLMKAKEWAHVVDVNKNIDNFSELVPNPARTFPFELDTFQKEAVYHLEQGDSVFVAAHTSAGKTVVAEYAIAMAERNMTKVIYTSPIKALSNQKYRDFRQIFSDVGILTGDVQINPEASCLIMTTEILRSMLYRGADLIRDVEFVIFDEVHYVNDQDRGVVWEEVIIMLPDHVKFILLSATVPNTYEFANWVGRTKRKDMYVISTPKRPVPLVHYMWAKTSMFEVVSAQKKFQETGWKALNNLLNPTNDGPGGGGGNARGGGQQGRGRGRGGGAPAPRGGRGGSARAANTAIARATAGGNRGGARGNSNLPGKTAFLHLIQHLHKKKLLPCVIFVFSKKRTEEYAMMLTSLDYCNAKEKSEIHMFIDKAVARLRKEDRELPQIMRMRDLLSRGIGVHHGGLLPIVKEVIEILFAKSLVKVLFATETFAMGLNLPTRTVVFSGIRKHDGREFRNLLPGEYTQMAGRAGRRGLDSEGTVIIMVNGPEPPPVSHLKEMMLGTPTKLSSQFRLTYNMILNLLRIEALKVEEMIKRSFSENASQVMLPEHEKNVKMNEETLSKLTRDPCAVCDQDIDEIHDLAVKYRQSTTQMLYRIMNDPLGRRILCPGRLIVYSQGTSREVGILFKTMLSTKEAQVFECSKTEPNARDVVPYLPFIKSYNKKHLRTFAVSKGFSFKTISFEDIEFVSGSIITSTLSTVLKGSKEATEAVLEELKGKMIRHQSKWREANLSKIKDADFHLMLKERQEWVDKIANSHAITCPNFIKHYSQVHEQYLIRKKIDDLKSMISDQNLELLPDYEQRIEVLKDLAYIDDNSNVMLKGRVACEVSSGFELIITELILDNFLGDYEPEEIVALLSAFVFEGNTDVESENVTPRLDRGKERIHDIVRNVNDICEKHQVLMTQEETDFLERKRFGLMEAVYEWARGMTFNEITELTDVQEGTIVRVITRLDEVCRQVMQASRIIGDASLHDKMALAQEKIKRDIVFCASLYL
uniref:ARAD1A03146p n=1 Tax=Blastobotrys adeninivorans TaxID=409370 RepID=A0A060SXD2_BLAAD